MNGREKISKIIKGIETSFEGEKTKSPDGMFGRKIIIKSGGVTIDESSLDVEFNIPFDNDTEANEAEIVVYNLSDATISNLKYNRLISATAGYGEDTGVVFSGRISRVSTKYVGVDKKTTIRAIDDINLSERKITDIAYKKNVKASYILKDLIGRLKLPTAVFKVKHDYVYNKGVNVDGGLMENIRKYAQVCGVSAYILKGKVYVHDIRQGSGVSFDVNVNTGLLDSPEEFEEEISEDNYKEKIRGCKIKTLLQHRITTGAKINLASRNISGVFFARSGSHSFDGSNFLTEMEVIQ